MASKTIKMAIADTLEDLSKSDYEKFCSQLLDRREEPKVKRSKVEDKSFLVVTDVLVNTFNESKALVVTLELLRAIDCLEYAERLEKETSAQSSKPGSSDTATTSAGATDGNTTGEEDEHFVDKHEVQLIRRVCNVSSILDELLQEKVIKREVYNKIRALSTSEEKMRGLYCGPLQGSTACKDIFYKILEENEPYLMADLKKKKK